MAYSSSSMSLEALATVSTIDESYSEGHTNDLQQPNNGTLHIRRRHQSNNNNSDSSPQDMQNDRSLHNKAMNESTTNSTPSQNPLVLLLCASGICTCYLYYGIVQEKLFSKNSNSAVKNCGNTTTFMLVLSSVTNVIVANLWIWVENKLSKKNDEKKNDDDNDDESKLGVNHKLFFYCKLNAQFISFSKCIRNLTSYFHTMIRT